MGEFFIEGYADQLSYAAGDQLGFHVSTRAAKYAVEIARIGFHISTRAAKYAVEIARIGAQREVVWQQEDLPGAEYPVPDNASSHGCGWPLAFSVQVPTTWRSGLPFATNRDGTPEGFEVLCTAPVQWHPDDCEWYERWEQGRKGQAVLGLYTRGGTVFTAGTTDWSHGLRGGDPAVARITRNVLERLSA